MASELVSAEMISEFASVESNIEKVSQVASAESNIEKVSEASLAEIDIEKICEAALAHHKGLPDDQKEAAKRFFEAMDKDKSRNISIDEFMTFLSFLGFQSDNHDELFAKLDKNGNKTLEFNELITFFYILSRDEYKHLLDRRPSADVPRSKGRFGLGMSGPKKQTWNWGDLTPLYRKLQGAYRLGNWVNENACHIM